MFINPMPFSPMQVIETNADYNAIAKDFLEKFAAYNKMGIAATHHYYNLDTPTSIRINIIKTWNIYETVGFKGYESKMKELGITNIVFNNLNVTTQPVGKKSVLMNIAGYMSINLKNYYFTSSIVIKLVSGSPRILNQILDIYYL